MIRRPVYDEFRNEPIANMDTIQITAEGETPDAGYCANQPCFDGLFAAVDEGRGVLKQLSTNCLFVADL